MRPKGAQRKALVLNEAELDTHGELYGWDKLRVRADADVYLAAYRRGDNRLHFWLSTGTCGSYLKHPTQGKTQLFRKKISPSEAEAIFDNPRVHTGKGYHEAAEQEKVKDEHKPGKRERKDTWEGKMGEDEVEEARPKKRSKISCMYGQFCTDKECMFEHRCRYGAKCSRDDCRYAHDLDDEEWWYDQLCMYGINCEYPTCKFKHPRGKLQSEPPPCRYGKHCKRMGCWYKHPPMLIQRRSTFIP